MPDRYAVIGNPIAHSKSPAIHAAFARQTQQDIIYEALLAPLDGFDAVVTSFHLNGGRGVNVTVPFKEQAFRYVNDLTERARVAQAVNTIKFDGDRVLGDNTDGVGLTRDIVHNLAFPLERRRILLLGAGGAARGVLGPLIAARPAEVVIANRTAARAAQLARVFSSHGPVRGGGYEEIGYARFDLVINATSASLDNALPPLPPDIFAPGALAYDMMYGKGLTPFLAFAEAQGAARLADGLGMLVEQAAEAFFLWRGVRPQTAPVIETLRKA